MKDKLRKKYQKSFNKKLRTLNKNIEKDPLWRGRFVFYQRGGCITDRFKDEKDKDEGIFTVYIRAYDKKTKYYKDYRLDYAPWMRTINWKITMDVANNFIVEALDVWRSGEDPRDDTVDYNKIKVNTKYLSKQPWNFYITYEFWEK